MSDELYQTLFNCEVCGINIAIPDPEKQQQTVPVECPKCGIQYEVRVVRTARPEGWRIHCHDCGDERFVTWQGMQKKSTPWHPTCDKCGSNVDPEPIFPGKDGQKGYLGVDWANDDDE